MVAGWQVGGTSDRQCGRGQELLDRQAVAQLAQGGLEDLAGVGLLDELHQRLDVIGKPDGPVHDLSFRSIWRACRLNPTAWSGSCAAFLLAPRRLTRDTRSSSGPGARRPS